MRYAITGGAGFLGKHLQKRLHDSGVKPSDIFVPLIEDFDFTQKEHCERLYKEAKPDVVIHLAAQVGGIGANQANPGRYFYANMSMGLHLIEAARTFGLKKFVQIGTICAYPKFTPVPFKEED